MISAIYGVILSKFTNQEKFFLSYPVDMRPVGFKNVTGCFVNNLLLKIDLKDHSLFSELLRNISGQRRVTNKYQGYSMTHIINDQRKLRGGLEANHFNVGITQANLNTLPFTLNNLDVSSIDITASREIHDELTLLYDEYSSNQLKFKLSCEKELFSEGFIIKFKEAFVRLIDDLLESEYLDIKQYSSIPSIEQGV